MSSRHDHLRLHGLDSPSGTIRERELHEVLSALPATSERAVRVAAPGESVSTGGKPDRWKTSLDFAVKWIHEGSTVLEIDAPCPGESGPQKDASLAVGDLTVLAGTPLPRQLSISRVAS